MKTMLSGYKEIASFLEKFWGVSVSKDAAFRYAKEKGMRVRRIRLPGSKRARVSIDAVELERWARLAITDR